MLLKTQNYLSKLPAEDSRSKSASNVSYAMKDVKPVTPVAAVCRSAFAECELLFPLERVVPVVGMSATHIRKIIGHSKARISAPELLLLLDQDSFGETFVPRSKILDYCVAQCDEQPAPLLDMQAITLVEGCALSLLNRVPKNSVQCVVTSTPYWAMRLYEDMCPVKWADGETCPLGMEQTPEGFIRHSVEILVAILPAMKSAGSVWWNIMDTYNTRTQIRSNAVEALRAMQGEDHTAWNDHECRRYSAGHSYLKDGEQCMIPHRIAERASRVGYFVKSVISWTKTSSLPEPQKSRVSRSVEYVLHLATQRTPYFDKEAYRSIPASLGGRSGVLESGKLSDFWHLPTSAGRDGHGAQFHLALPGRCIALSSKPGDVVLDPFVGAGTSVVAAKLLGRRYVGFDISPEYLAISKSRLASLSEGFDFESPREMAHVHAND